jgi:PHD/YefM family antitoxin component YafN of YafNO toxin-antitoxin module
MNKDLERLLELYHKNRDDNGILMSKDEWKEYQTLKSKLESQLLSEGKYESLMEANSQVVQDNITMSQYQQQIKELQDECIAQRLLIKEQNQENMMLLQDIEELKEQLKESY